MWTQCLNATSYFDFLYHRSAKLNRSTQQRIKIQVEAWLMHLHKGNDANQSSFTAATQPRDNFIEIICGPYLASRHSVVVVLSLRADCTIVEEFEAKRERYSLCIHSSFSVPEINCVPRPYCIRTNQIRSLISQKYCSRSP